MADADDDPLSTSFDAVKSLYKCPTKEDEDKLSNVPVFKSVADLEEHLLKNEPDIVNLLEDRERELTEQKDKANDQPKSPESENAQRIPPSTVPKPRPNLVPTKKPAINTVLTKIQKFEFRGPLTLLCRCVHEKLKMKVWIRGRTKIRSILTCYVAAFDKHWNLALTDVDELYYKKKFINVFRVNKKKAESESIREDIPDSLRYTSVNKSLNNYEIVRRHVPQLFVKGDNIVIISVIR